MPEGPVAGGDLDCDPMVGADLMTSNRQKKRQARKAGFNAGRTGFKNKLPIMGQQEDPMRVDWKPGAFSRKCGGCTMCCVALPILELDSPAGEACQHLCETGCGVFDDRPSPVCAEFSCNWLKGDGELDQRPDRMGALPTLAEDRKALVMYLAPGLTPETIEKLAWRYMQRWMKKRGTQVEVLWGPKYLKTTTVWPDGFEATHATNFTPEAGGIGGVNADEGRETHGERGKDRAAVETD